ncbi:hypothetical protein B0H13DRAFT_1915090 [Mycena leptocephala]|nr:hypothetical protein B0H13DRAFT_1915090 [Mycena leptocephala]
MLTSQRCGTCPSWFQETLTAERQCEGNGAEIKNWDRRYQRCTACQLWLWHDPETSLEDIPEHIKVKFALKESLAMQQTPPSKQKTAGTPRLSVPTAARKVLHHTSTSFTSPTSAAPPPDDAPRHNFARPFSENYGKPYIQAHQKLFQANARVNERPSKRTLRIIPPLQWFGK